MDQDEAGKLSRRLNAAGIELFLTPSNDIEAVFLDPDHITAVVPTILRPRAVELIQQAIDEARAASIEAIINQRVAAAFRRRTEGGAQINHGELALTATRDFDANPKGMARGKPTLARLRALIQAEIGANPILNASSSALRQANLHSVATRLWPPAAGAAPAPEPPAQQSIAAEGQGTSLRENP